MGKNKPSGQKQKNVFKVSGKQTKSKNKAKPVTSSLKRLGAAKNDSVESLNKIFTDVQREMKSVSKCTKPKASHQRKQTVREEAQEPVNVESTTQLFSQL